MQPRAGLLLLGFEAFGGPAHRGRLELPFTPDSWTAPVDALRIAPATDATDATIGQVRRLVEALGGEQEGEAPLFVFDAGYDSIALGAGLKDVRAQVLVRIKSDRVFYGEPGPRRGPTKGRPPRHGRRFKLSDPKSAPRPDAQIQLHDPRYGTVRVRAWHDRHPKLHGRGRWAGPEIPIVRGSVIRVDVEHLPNPIGRTKKTLWLWWSGPGAPDLELCFCSYLRRFDIEHAYEGLAKPSPNIGETRPKTVPKRETRGPKPPRSQPPWAQEQRPHLKVRRVTPLLRLRPVIPQEPMPTWTVRGPGRAGFPTNLFPPLFGGPRWHRGRTLL